MTAISGGDFWRKFLAEIFSRVPIGSFPVFLFSYCKGGFGDQLLVRIIDEIWQRESKFHLDQIHLDQIHLDQINLNQIHLDQINLD